MNDDFVFLGLSIFAVFVCLGLMVFMHEEVHQTIFHYAGIESEISFDLSGGHTTPLPDQNVSMPLWANIGQVNNEAFGYQIQSATIGIMLTMIICSLYLGWKFEGGKRADN